MSHFCVKGPLYPHGGGGVLNYCLKHFDTIIIGENSCQYRLLELGQDCGFEASLYMFPLRESPGNIFYPAIRICQ